MLHFNMAVPGATHFYHYSAPNLKWLRPLLLSHQLYLPTPAQLNDPAEATPRIGEAPPRQLARFLAKRLGLTSPPLSLGEAARQFSLLLRNVEHHGPAWVSAKMSELLHNNLKDLKIYSMSLRWNNMSLWATYADNHKGYCLEFGNEWIFTAARKVQYQDLLPINVASYDPTNIDVLYQKTLDWNNEEEVRLILSQHKPQTIQILPSVLSRIILGKDMRPHDRDTILNWARRRKPPLAVDQAQYDAVAHRLGVTRMFDPPK
jgi:hypothetical protein